MMPACVFRLMLRYMRSVASHFLSFFLPLFLYLLLGFFFHIFTLYFSILLSLFSLCVNMLFLCLSSHTVFHFSSLFFCLHDNRCIAPSLTLQTSNIVSFTFDPSLSHFHRLPRHSLFKMPQRAIASCSFA